MVAMTKINGMISLGALQLSRLGGSPGGVGGSQQGGRQIREELLGCLKEKWIYEKLIPGTDVKLNTSQPIPALLCQAGNESRVNLVFSTPGFVAFKAPMTRAQAFPCSSLLPKELWESWDCSERLSALSST